jgi:hypothetical protein
VRTVLADVARILANQHAVQTTTFPEKVLVCMAEKSLVDGEQEETISTKMICMPVRLIPSFHSRKVFKACLAPICRLLDSPLLLFLNLAENLLVVLQVCFRQQGTAPHIPVMVRWLKTQNTRNFVNTSIF